MQLVVFLLFFLPAATKWWNARIHQYHYGVYSAATDAIGTKAPAVSPINVYVSSLQMSATMKRADDALYSYENG